MPEALACHLCGDAAVAVFYFSHGCRCSAERVQPLCPQHAFKSGPSRGGSMELVVDLTVGCEFTRRWGRFPTDDPVDNHEEFPMGSNYDHLKSHVPGQGHELNSGAGEGVMKQTGARQVPHLPNGSNHDRGNRADGGERANIVPSCDNEPATKGGHPMKPA